ncbi:MAG: diaminohydroxyphosphoribosylaminopyrimidine deaminase [Thermoanaerobaculia bacterium]|nr:diaminohydroxyphosphoribosylaminopyrimidine deaminase [Thermoanaerobaculia bacterium]
MRRALELAERGRYSVNPNPMVGCVIVRDGIVIAEGWHRRAGEPHAEIEALRDCEARGATMIVTLEPCTHHGRTPPCVDAIIAAGIANVVIAMRDPHVVASGGVERLREAGIEVTTGVLEAEARRLNEKFFYAVTHQRPFVLLKAGMTLDGKLATISGQSQWITSEASREKSLALREEYDAILAGGGTIRADNPRLSRRLGWNTSAAGWTRVVLDRARLAPADATVLTDGGATIHITEDVDIETLLSDLYTRGIHSLIVEGGSAVLSEFIRRNLWQKMILFVAPMVIGGANAPSIFSSDGIAALTDAHRLRFDRVEMVGSDVMMCLGSGGSDGFISSESSQHSSTNNSTKNKEEAANSSPTSHSSFPTPHT